jgi:hypothetical protein
MNRMFGRCSSADNGEAEHTSRNPTRKRSRYLDLVFM